MLKLRRWWEMGKTGGSFPAVGNWTVVNATAGLVWFSFETDTGMSIRQTSMSSPEHAPYLMIAGSNYLNSEIPWYVIATEDQRNPRRHYFRVLFQIPVGGSVQVFLEPELTFLVDEKSIVTQLFQFEPAIVTEARLQEEYDDDMLYWRFEARLRAVMSTWRYQALIGGGGGGPLMAERLIAAEV